MANSVTIPPDVQPHELPSSRASSSVTSDVAMAAKPSQSNFPAFAVGNCGSTNAAASAPRMPIGQVDVEDQPPVHVLDEVTADDRPERRGEDDPQPVHAHGRPSLSFGTSA